MTKPIEPGDVCIIVGENHGFEANIGALITVTELQRCRHGALGWLWKDASRPIVVVIGRFTGMPKFRATSSLEARSAPEFEGCDVGYPAKHLMPVKGEGLEDESHEEAPVEGKPMVFNLDLIDQELI